MAKAKKHVSKNPNKYVWALEKGYGHIPSRPLVQPTLVDYMETFATRIKKARQAMKDTWK